MRDFAIRGHATKGKEVIRLLELLGGKNGAQHSGDCQDHYYFIRDDGHIYCTSREVLESELCEGSCSFFDLEHFLKKFPFKTGDKILINDKVYEITNMGWDYIFDEVSYITSYDSSLVFKTEELKPYKEDWTYSDAEKEFIKAKIKSEYFMKYFGLNAGKLGGKGLLDQMECNYSDFNVAAYEAYSNAIKRNRTEVTPNHEKDVLGLLEEFTEFAKASEDKPSEHLPEYTEAAEELADILIGCLTELYKRNVDVGSIIRDKMNFNKTRKA